jgi:hypothetical protein
MRVQHFDRFDVRLDRSTVQVLPDGARLVDGVGAHVGPYLYHDDKGQPFTELVPASTLFEPASLESAAGTSVTIRHGPGLVTPDRYRTENHGAWVKAWPAGPNADGVHELGVRLRIGSQEGLDFLDAALGAGSSVELSPVYMVDVETNADGVLEQRNRSYSGIALLAEGEARGGAGTKLSLDGPTCAPAGSRIQIRAARLDNATRAALHSETKRPNAMKHAHISNDGRRRKVSADTLASIRGQAKSHKDAANSDAIAVGRVLVEIEGEEPVDLVLPVSMIEMLLEGIGATSTPPAAEVPLEGEEVAMEGPAAQDAAPVAMDAAAIARIVDARVRVQLDARDKADSRRASVRADAVNVLAPGYNFDGSTWHQWALDGIARKAPDREAEARKHHDAAKAGDAEAAGQLRQMLRDVARVTGDAGKLQLVQGDDKVQTAPWASPVMPKAGEKT